MLIIIIVFIAYALFFIIVLHISRLCVETAHKRKDLTCSKLQFIKIWLFYCFDVSLLRYIDNRKFTITDMLITNLPWLGTFNFVYFIRESLECGGKSSPSEATIIVVFLIVIQFALFPFSFALLMKFLREKIRPLFYSQPISEQDTDFSPWYPTTLRFYMAISLFPPAMHFIMTIIAPYPVSQMLLQDGTISSDPTFQVTSSMSQSYSDVAHVVVQTV